MKKVIPFTKEITFKTMIGEITDITVEHTLQIIEDNQIEGDFLVTGTYKMTEASQIEEKFDYQLPFTIELDDKYDLSDCGITISDFYFEIINEEILKVNIEVELSEIKEKSILEETRRENSFSDIEELDDEYEVEGISLDEKDIRSHLEKVEPTEMMMKQEDLQIDFGSNHDDEVEEIDILDQAPIEKVIKMHDVSEEKIEKSSNKSVSSIFSAISNTEETFSTYYVYIVRDMDTVDSIVDKYKTTKEDLSHYNDLNDVKVGTKLIIPCNNE